MPDTISEKVEEIQAGKNILVVDDAKTMRRTIAKALKTAGYNVDEAEDGIDALNKAKDKEYDLFTIDILMPRMDGYELTKNLRNLPQYSTTPMIMVSSKSEKIDKLRGLDSGADEYITKPFEKSHLIKMIMKFLG